MQHLFSRAFAIWLPILVALTGVFGFSYLAVQQDYRQSSNDPQMQMAEDAAASLAADYTPANIVPHGIVPIEMSQSLAPWIVVYDAAGVPLESSATLDGVPPQLPSGLFDTKTWLAQKTFAAAAGPETRVTWQPREGVRQAVVLVRFDAPHGAGYVAAGRSMRATEDRIMNLTHLAEVAWSVTALASLIAIFILLSLGWL